MLLFSVKFSLTGAATGHHLLDPRLSEPSSAKTSLF